MMRKRLILFLGLSALMISVGLRAQTAQEVKQAYSDLSVFEDALALRLKKGVKKKQINQISDTTLRRVALSILDGEYDTEYKYATYYALLSPTTLGHRLSIGDGYSKYENMTGVYLPKGKHIVMVDGIAKGKEVSLVVPNWLRKAPNPQEPTKDPKGWGLEKQVFRLQNGVNIIQLDNYGSLAYIDYFSDAPEKENPITVHFPTGQINGYFDIKKHGNKEWNGLIDQAVFPIMDAKGEHIQTAYPVEAMKKYAYGKGVELIRNYDSLVYRQHRLMGLEKYNKVPKNRILARVNYNYYMFRDGDGVAYMGDKVGYAMQMVVTPESAIKGDPCWGFSHEVGHVHQTRPMFNWGGLGEVSNNLFSLYVTRSFGNKTRVSEQNNFEKAKRNIIDKKISYLSDPDVFDRLVPFWQLQLYFEGVGKHPDFYADLFEAFRQQNLNKPRRERSDWSSDRMMGERNPAIHQLNFVKTACEVAKLDLTDFFDKYGFFFVGTLEYDDYGKYTYTMTPEMADACRQAIKNMNLPKPKIDLTILRD